MPKYVKSTDYLRPNVSFDAVFNFEEDKFFYVLNYKGLHYEVYRCIRDLLDEKNVVQRFETEEEYDDWLEEAEIYGNDEIPTFPNGFTSWYETHHELVDMISFELRKKFPCEKLRKISEELGTGGAYELAKELTDKFEDLNKGRQWDGEFFEEIEEFARKEFYKINKD